MYSKHGSQPNGKTNFLSISLSLTVDFMYKTYHICMLRIILNTLFVGTNNVFESNVNADTNSIHTISFFTGHTLARFVCRLK